MNVKRWIAVAVVAALVVVSIGVNTLSFAFTRDMSSFMDAIAEEASSTSTVDVIEKGNMDEKIVTLSLDGVIQDAGNVGLLGGAGYDHTFFMEQLKNIEEDPTVKGVILRVNSPGGGVLESADIYDGLVSIMENREIPVYVSMGGMAASGGYYVSAPATKIFVNQETITGSIGVIMQSLNYAKLAERIGIDFNTIKTGPYKDMMSPNREMRDDERALLQEMVNDSYERFVDIIAKGRDMKVEDVKKVADGRIMNGRQAIEAGLADEFGKYEDVIAAMKEEQSLEDAAVVTYVPQESLRSLFGMKVQQWINPDFETQLLTKLMSENSAPRMMYLYGEQ